VQLTPEMLTPYAGGQLELQNIDGNYMYRGQIATIEVVDDTLVVTLDWMAKNLDYPATTSRWMAHDDLEYQASLEIYSASDFGTGHICLQSRITGELVVLFLPGLSTLDPAKVEGLVLSP
jgi:hypothetical protein